MPELTFPYCITVGGPLIVRPGGGAEYDILVGLVSWGVGCAYLPGVFSRVSKSYDWIVETVCAESNDPPGSLCDLNRISESDIFQTSIQLSISVRRCFQNVTNMCFAAPNNIVTHTFHLFYFSQPPPTYHPTSTPNEQPTSTPSMSSQPTSGPPTLALPPTLNPTMSPTTLKPTKPPSASAPPPVGSSSKKTAEPELSTLQEDAGGGAEPEVSTLQEDEVDGVILDVEESKAPINSSRISDCSFVAVASVGSMISMLLIL